MASRALVVFVAVAMLLVPATALAGDDHTTVEVPGGELENDDQHETRITLDADGGTWQGPYDGEIPAVNLAVLPGGDLFYYSGIVADDEKDDTTHLHFMWNATPQRAESRVASYDGDGLDVTTPSPSEAGTFDLFCSGTTITPEGIAVAPGATKWHTLDEDPPANFYTPLKGANQTMLFDPAGDWTDGPAMDVPRWYPSALQLPDGDTLVASGIRTLFYPNTYNTMLETWDPDTEDGWQTLESSIQIADGVDVPQRVLPDTPDSGLAFVDETHQGLPNLPMYPRLHVIPSGPHQGEVLYPANGDVWAPFGQHPTQEVFSHLQTLDPDTGAWEVHPRSDMGHRNLGTVVPLMVDASEDEPDARYLSLGGTLQQSGVATSTSEIVDASGETIESEVTDSMTFPRWSVNGVLLPDGSVVAVGGSVYDNVLMYTSPTIGPTNAERFVPGDDGGGEWQLMPGMEDVRAYHSTAVLLPDASVAVAGHVPLPAPHDAQRSELGNAQPNDTTIEILEPSYLDRPTETRPEIETVGFEADLPSDADALAIPDAQEEATIHVENIEHGLESLVLVRPSAATHQYNADQLAVELDVSDTSLDATGSGTVTFDAPDDLAIPPGHYMLFANEGISEGEVYPSKAAWVALGDDVTLEES